VVLVELPVAVAPACGGGPAEHTQWWWSLLSISPRWESLGNKPRWGRPLWIIAWRISSCGQNAH
jgi:hypothetical protein